MDRYEQKLMDRLSTGDLKVYHDWYLSNGYTFTGFDRKNYGSKGNRLCIVYNHNSCGHTQLYLTDQIKIHTQCNNKDCKQSRVRLTNKEKFGDENFFRTQAFKNKAKETCLDRYGVDNYSKTTEFKERRQQSYINTMQSTYGVDNYFQTQELQDKRKQKLGNEFVPMNQPGALEKYKQTSLDKYGVTHPSKSQEVKDKIANKLNINYNKEIQDYIKSTEAKQHISFYIDHDYEILGIQDNRILIKHNSCGTTQLLNTHQFKTHYNCQNASCLFEMYKESSHFNTEEFKLQMQDKYVYRDNAIFLTNPSNFAKEVGSWLESHNIKFTYEKLFSYNPYLSVDIYVPAVNLSIECNGTYWHATKRPNSDTRDLKSQNYHKIKSELAEQCNTQLYHLFEFDWLENKDKIQAQLLQLINRKSLPKLHANSCYIGIVNYNDTKIFLNNNHIQGMYSSKINLGLYLSHNKKGLDKDTLVALMCFSNPSTNSARQLADYDLTRFCTLNGYSVYEAATTLFNYFVNTYNPDSIISYSDIGKTSGSLYNTLGFTYIGDNSPRYYWSNLKVTYKRRQCQKQYLPKLLNDSTIDLSKTEDQIMLEHGFYKVYDAGLRVHLWTKDKQ